jgi:hypothetical protein
MNEDHVGEMLSGYIDGELTQQDRQRVRLHCEVCQHCRRQLEDLRTMRDRVGAARLSTIDENAWRETMNDTTVRATRGIGWLLFIGGILLASGFAVYEIITDSSLSAFEKTIIGGIYGGLLLLFVSVLRQRLIERKTDKYKDVEI